MLRLSVNNCPWGPTHDISKMITTRISEILIFINLYLISVYDIRGVKI